MPIADLSPKRDRSLGDALSDLAKSVRGSEKAEEAVRTFWLENPKEAERIVKADVMRELDFRRDLEAGKLSSPAQQAHYTRLGKAGEQMQLGRDLDYVSTAGALVGEGGRQVPPSMIAELRRRFPDAVREAQVEWKRQQQVTPEEEAGLQVTQFRAAEATAETERMQAEREREVLQKVQERFPADDQATLFVLQFQNQLEQARQQEGFLEMTAPMAENALDFYESLSPMERNFLTVGNVPGGQYLAQLWLGEMQYDWSVGLQRMRDAKTRQEMIYERGQVSAFFGGQINDAMERLKQAIDDKDEGLIDSIIREIHVSSRNLMAIDPAYGFIQLNKVKGMLGGIKDFEIEFGDLLDVEGEQLMAIAQDMANEGYNPDNPRDPVLQRVKQIPGIVDPLTGAVNEDMVDVVKTLAVQYILGRTPDVDATQVAALEANAMGALTQVGKDELTNTRVALRSAMDDPNVPVSEKLKLIQRVRILTMRNWMLMGEKALSAEPIRMQSGGAGTITKLPGGGQ